MTSPLKLYLLIIISSLFSINTFSYETKPFSNMFIFGDSLSDTGNLQVFSQNPSMPNRFTNGPVAIEVIANKLNLNINNSLHLTGAQYGNNFAVAGAIAIDEDNDEGTFDINLPTQINSYLAFNQYQADQDALYIIMIGGNDIRAAREAFINGSWGEIFTASSRLNEATDSIQQQLYKLVSAGAQNIMLVNAPNIGAIPETDIVALNLKNNTENFRDQFIAKNLEEIAEFLTLNFNRKLKRVAKRVSKETGIKINHFNLFKFFNKLNKNYLKEGFSNNTDACIYIITQNGTPNPSCNLDTFLFYDEIHPTANVHALSGNALYQAIVKKLIN